MLHDICDIAMKPVTEVVDSRCFEWFIMTQSIDGIAVDTIRIYEHICAYLPFVQ